ncbi:MAG: PilZ domain-containing protein [Planctomycetes bacterium]|nr:PilZ domain-containing protein [Planctomycetota bacterium]
MNSVNPMQIRPGSERRQFRRFPIRLPVKARRDDLVGNADPSTSDPRPEGLISIDVDNFSLGGLRGSSSVALRCGEALTVHMPPFGTRPEVDVTGRVTRCQRVDRQFDVGVEFCQTSSAADSSPWLRLPELFYMAGQMDRRFRQ